MIAVRSRRDRAHRVAAKGRRWLEIRQRVMDRAVSSRCPICDPPESRDSTTDTEGTEKP